MSEATEKAREILQRALHELHDLRDQVAAADGGDTPLPVALERLGLALYGVSSALTHGAGAIHLVGESANLMSIGLERAFVNNVVKPPRQGDWWQLVEAQAQELEDAGRAFLGSDKYLLFFAYSVAGVVLSRAVRREMVAEVPPAKPVKPVKKRGARAGKAVTQ